MIIPKVYSMSYGTSLMTVMSNMTLLILVSSWVFELLFLPKTMVHFRIASIEFKNYITIIVDYAKQEAVTR